MPTAIETLERAKACHRDGRLRDAEPLYRQVLRDEPANAEVHFLLGVACHGLGKTTEALSSLMQAVRLKEDYAVAHNYLGAVLANNSRLDEAVACFRRSVQLQPDFAEAHRNLGGTLTNQGRLDEAAVSCRKALELQPEDVDTLICLATVLERQVKLAEAATFCDRALRLRPDDARAHQVLGTILARQEKWDEAAAAHRRAVELQPQLAAAHNNLGAVLAKQGKFNESLDCFQRALTLRPDLPDAHYNRAVTLLLTGRLAEGWQEYEWRWTARELRRALPQPLWTGAPLANRTILLHSEQGFGDTLQFVRYAELVKQRGGRVIVECRRPLADLLARCAGVDQILIRDDPLPQFDVLLPMLSLPRVFGTSLENIPARVPYLWPDATVVERWREELSRQRGLKIGIAWRGSADHPADRSRSMGLAQFAAIARTPGVHLYSLQAGTGHEELSAVAGQWPIADLADRLGDFHNTAAIVRNLDLVITCDSAPAHLAGGLGVPVWVALASMPDWRWLLDRDDSPWYPTMRLFRQTRSGDWSSVFARMADELRSLSPRPPLS